MEHADPALIQRQEARQQRIRAAAAGRAAESGRDAEEASAGAVVADVPSPAAAEQPPAQDGSNGAARVREPVASLEALAATLDGYKLHALPAWKGLQLDSEYHTWSQPLPTREAAGRNTTVTLGESFARVDGAENCTALIRDAIRWFEEASALKTSPGHTSEDATTTIDHLVVPHRCA